MNHILLEFRCYEDAPLAYNAPNHHTASDTRTELMDSTVPIEAGMMGKTCPVRGCLSKANGSPDGAERRGSGRF